MRDVTAKVLCLVGCLCVVAAAGFVGLTSAGYSDSTFAVAKMTTAASPAPSAVTTLEWRLAQYQPYWPVQMQITYSKPFYVARITSSREADPSVFVVTQKQEEAQSFSFSKGAAGPLKPVGSDLCVTVNLPSAPTSDQKDPAVTLEKCTGSYGQTFTFSDPVGSWYAGTYADGYGTPIWRSRASGFRTADVGDGKDRKYYALDMRRLDTQPEARLTGKPMSGTAPGWYSPLVYIPSITAS